MEFFLCFLQIRSYNITNKSQKTKISKTICKIPKICYNKQSKLISRWQNSKGFARGKSGLQRAMMLDNV